tara:strand:- start:83 stop:880 length:798 start_codon:yes stop_codon:yes gene_type:complete
MLIVTKHNDRGVFYNRFETDENKKKVAVNNYNKLKVEIKKVFKKHLYKNAKNSFYWELGTVISGFINSFGALPERYVADHIEASNSIFTDLNPEFLKTDFKRGRDTAYYFYLLSKFPKTLVLKTSWSFWSYFFQLKYFRAMPQMIAFLSSRKSLDEFKEGFRRVFFGVAGALFNGCDISTWEADDVSRTIFLSYDIVKGLSSQLDFNRGDERKRILGNNKMGYPRAYKHCIEKHYQEYLLCMAEKKDTKGLCLSILEEFKLYTLK